MAQHRDSVWCNKCELRRSKYMMKKMGGYLSTRKAGVKI